MGFRDLYIDSFIDLSQHTYIADIVFISNIATYAYNIGTFSEKSSFQHGIGLALNSMN